MYKVSISGKTIGSYSVSWQIEGDIMQMHHMYTLLPFICVRTCAYMHLRFFFIFLAAVDELSFRIRYHQNQNQNQNCLLVIRPRTIIHQDLCLGKLVPSPHKRSKLSN